MLTEFLWEKSTSGKSFEELPDDVKERQDTGN